MYRFRMSYSVETGIREIGYVGCYVIELPPKKEKR
jgi:hypothetical protein